MTSFGWLHLTDLHLGMNQQCGLLPTVEDKFFDDLKRHYEKTAPWDLVVFTGDLTFKGTADEFKRVDDFLDRLWTLFRELGANPSLAAVPGNHDLSRPDLNRNRVARLLRNSWDNDPDISRQFWSDPKCDLRETINTAFENYSRWWEKTQFKLASSQPGDLPGDFSAVLLKGDASIGIVGLNTTFLQLAGGDYKTKLAVDPLQFQKVCNENGPAWVKQHNATLLLTHQPPDWLNENALTQLVSDISSYFDVHLFGHMHESRYVIQVPGGGHDHRVFQATSLFGLDEFEAPEKNQRRHGYAIGRITLEDDEGQLIIWPRQARRVDRVWNFVTDQDNIYIEDDHTVPRSFALKKPVPKPMAALSISVSTQVSTTPETQPLANRWAVMVGVNDYKYFSKLQFCRQDAMDLAHVFREQLRFAEVYEFHEEASADFKPTRDCIFEKLADFRDSNKCRTQDLLVFYFSGHGITENGRDYLLPINARPRHVSTLGIRVEDLVTSLRDFGCENTLLFIDACREAVQGTKGTAAIGEDSSSIISDAGMVAFFSCDPRERSYEIEPLHHGSFTYCILQAIQQNAVSTVDELNHYLIEEVPKINDKYQKPPQRPRSIIVPPGRGKLRILPNQRGPRVTYEDLVEELQKVRDEGKIDGDDWITAVEFLYSLGDGSRRYPNATTMLDAINAICKGKWQPDTFRKFWKRMQARRLPAPEFKRL